MSDSGTRHDDLNFGVQDLPTDALELPAKGLTVEFRTANTGFLQSGQSPPGNQHCS